MKYPLPMLLFLCIILFSCRNEEEAKPLVGLSLPTQREERWVRDKESMIVEAKKLGLELKIAISDNDAVLQISQAKELLSQNISLLIVAPQDAHSASTIVDMANAKKIPVISYDRLILDAPLKLYVSFDNWEVGRLQARYLLSKAPQGNYVIFSGSPTDNNSAMFHKGAMEILKPFIDSGDIHILMDEGIPDWKPAEAYRMTNEVLSKTTRIDAILAPNDGTARGILTALEEHGLAGEIPVTGQDGEIEGARLIIRGLQGMTVFKDTRLLAEKTIEISKQLIEGKKIAGPYTYIDNGFMDVPSILLKPVLVTKDNLDKVLIDSGYIRREDVYGKE